MTSPSALASRSPRLREIESAILARSANAASLVTLLQDWLAADQLAGAMNEVLASGLQGPFTYPGGITNDTLVLLDNPTFTFYLQTVRRAGSSLCSVGSDRIVAVKSTAPVHVVTYRIDAAVDLDVFDPQTPLLLLGRRQYDGQPIHEKRAELIVYDYESAEPFVKVCISPRQGSGQVWLFNRATLRASYAALESITSSGCVMLCRLVGALGERRAMPMVRELTEHPSHVVRWAAIQSIAKLDAQSGIELLQRATEDSHPHVSAAARKALQRLGPSAKP